MHPLLSLESTCYLHMMIAQFIIYNCTTAVMSQGKQCLAMRICYYIYFLSKQRLCEGTHKIDGSSFFLKHHNRLVANNLIISNN